MIALVVGISCKKGRMGFKFMLEKINEPKDIKNLSKGELLELAQDIREFLVKSVSKTGGH